MRPGKGYRSLKALVTGKACMLRLALVPFQLSLEGFGPPVSDFIAAALSSSPWDLEKEKRTSQQWLKSVRDYCMWRAGDGWRKLQQGERWSAARWEYLDAARLITDILLTGSKPTPKESAKDAAAQAQLDLMRGLAAPLSPEENKLLQRPRAQLVDELLRDSLYTDGRLLSRLPRRKLARMVSESRERAAAGLGADRRCA